jgi:hypothetical protein
MCGLVTEQNINILCSHNVETMQLALIEGKGKESGK